MSRRKKFQRKSKIQFAAHPVDALLGAAAEMICAYFRVEVDGLENIPKTGPAILIANHSGFAGTDAVVLIHLLRSRVRSDVCVLAHPFYFKTFGLVRKLATRKGLLEASVDQGLAALRDEKLLIIFPEGERGNFKSSLKRYRLQKFHTGFVRMAIRAKVPVIPCAITGAEESHISLGSIDLRNIIRGLRIPLPVNLIPFPAKWRIRFFRPVRYQKDLKNGRKQNWILEQTQRARADLQRKLWEEKDRAKAA